MENANMNVGEKQGSSPRLSVPSETQVSESLAVGTLPRARLRRCLVAGLRDLWDQLGLILGISVTWALFLLLPLSAVRWLPGGPQSTLHSVALLAVVLFSALPTAGVFAVIHRITEHEEATYFHLWQDGIRLFGPAVKLGAIQAGVTGAFLTAGWFYLRIPFWIGKAALILCLYALLMWTMMLVYQWPVLVAQEKGQFDAPERQAKRGAFAAIRRSFFLALARPFFTLGLVAALLLVAITLSATVVLPVLLGIGTLSLLSTHATRGLLVEFGVIAPPVVAEVVPDEKFRLPEQ